MSWLSKFVNLPNQFEEQVRDDFEVVKNERPFRCCLCSQMQAPNSDMVWVGDSAGFFKSTDTYQSLVNSGKGSSRSGACMPCVRSCK